MIKLTEEEFILIDRYVRDKFGLNMERKQYLVESRLWAELEQSGYTSFSDYWSRLLLDKSGQMATRLSDCLTTNYTYFMREEKHFTYIQTDVLPKVKRPLAVWCAGCATGQESYTLAMLLAESRDIGKFAYDYRIVATDLSTKAIEVAQTGIYHRSDFDRLPDLWKIRYCLTRDNGDFLVSTRIRDTVRYIQQNLMNTRPGNNKYDVVFCRNVLIYFKEQERNIVLRNIYESMKPGGLLFIGLAESLLGCQTSFEYIKPGIYQKPEATV